MTEDEMVGQHHQFSGQELGKTPGDGEGQGGLVAAIHHSCRVRHDLVTKRKCLASLTVPATAIKTPA